ncbi:MAG: glycine cleavage system aminomethyltransferase GcvT [Candidatus Hodarchaeales archaeon]
MKTQLYNWHKKNGDIIEFAGFEMPVMYSSIKEEHMTVRNAVGLFDVSHMGRMWIKGLDSEKFLNFLVPRDLSKTKVGRASYTFMLNERGGFKDDLVFERIASDTWLLVWNAGNLMKILSWITTLKSFVQEFTDLDVSLENISQSSAMFALQGPKAEPLLKSLLGDVAEPPSSWGVITSKLGDIDLIVSGTGYTGEAGYEIIVLDTTLENPSKAEKIWNKLLEIGKEFGIKPCGLGARDSLRLEAGMHLYGNDLNEDIDPITAGLFFPPFVHMDKENFIGKTALESFSKNKAEKKRRIGLIAIKKGPSPRKGQKVFFEGTEIGEVTSGGYSPLLEIGIGMAYIRDYPNLQNEETIVQFEVRGRMYEAKISKFPLYDTDKYGKKRKI